MTSLVEIALIIATMGSHCQTLTGHLAEKHRERSVLAYGFHFEFNVQCSKFNVGI